MVLIVNKTPQSMLIGRIVVPPITPIALREDRFVMEKVNSLVAAGDVEIINVEEELESQSRSKYKRNVRKG